MICFIIYSLILTTDLNLRISVFSPFPRYVGQMSLLYDFKEGKSRTISVKSVCNKVLNKERKRVGQWGLYVKHATIMIVIQNYGLF